MGAPDRSQADGLTAFKESQEGTQGAAAAPGRRAGHGANTQVRRGAGDELAIGVLRRQRVDDPSGPPAGVHHHQPAVPKAKDEGPIRIPEAVGNFRADHGPGAGGVDESDVLGAQPADETTDCLIAQHSFQRPHAWRTLAT